MRPNIPLLKGQQFNNLTVISLHHKKKNKKYFFEFYLCKCKCGNEVVVYKNDIKNGHTKSCGCLRGRTKKHGLLNTRLYHIWQSMKARCFSNYYKNYSCYGGRGITVCEEWKNDFMQFYEWAIKNGYKENLTIDRIDVNGNYEPSNCRFITIKEQNRNKRNNVKIYYNGQEKCISEWAELFGIKKGLLYGRLKRGWPIERALNKL